MALTISEYLPKQLLSEISEHLRLQGNSAHELYPYNSEDEDSITGALSGSLYHRMSHIYIGVRRWGWSVSSKKFSGKGPGAREGVLGADAMVEFALENEAGQSITKGLLFQAKKDGSQQKLFGQVETMERVAKGSSAILDYSVTGYRALDGAEYLAHQAMDDPRTAHKDGIQLGDYLADEFISCKVGIPGMSYDATAKELRIPADRIGSIKVPARVRRRLRITAVGPFRFP